MTNVAVITPAHLVESVSDGKADALTDSRWEEIYRLCRFAEEGIAFEAFLEAPWKVLRQQGQEGAVESIRNGYRRYCQLRPV